MGGERMDAAGDSRDRGDGDDGGRSRSPGNGRRRDDGGGEGGGGGRERAVDDGSRSRSRDRDRDRDRERDRSRGGRRRRGDNDGETARGSRRSRRDRDGASGRLDHGKERSDGANKNGDHGDDGRTRRSRSRSRDRDRDRDRDRGARGGGSGRRQQGSGRRNQTRDRRSSGHRRRNRGDDDRDSRRRSTSKKRRDRGGRNRKRSRRRSPSSSSSSFTSYSSSSSPSGSSSDTSSSGSGSSSSSTSSSSSYRRSKKRRRNKPHTSKRKKVEVVANERLLSKLASRGETLEEREERRAKRRAERIASRFGYTPEDNPFNDPNLHETFSWKKKEAAAAAAPAAGASAAPKKKGRKEEQEHILSEIDKVRKRRADREAQQDEMERLRAEESRLRELENYDEWAAKEEEFHLQQQRQRSAIRLLEKREKPVDALAKNLLLFGLTEEEKTNRAKVKYQERYDALAELDTLEAELVEPHELLKDLKLLELQELLGDIEAYRDLEREAAAAAAKDGGAEKHDHAASEMIIRYWDNLHLVTRDEIRYVQTGGKGGAHSAVVDDIQRLFEDKSAEALQKMKEEVVSKLNSNETGVDTEYWGSVLSQLDVHRAKEELSDVHNMMLARQLEKLERRKEALSKLAAEGEEGEPGGTTEAARAEEKREAQQNAALQTLLPSNVNDVNFGNLEESLGLSSEVNLGAASYAWQDKYRPRKPRYFNRVKTGYDWNKYNQTHYDHDNPPPKIVQGYKFNVFYPDLIDKTRTPEYKLEPADTDEFCILRFRAGPPYEDVAFKIINREWNRSRKRGFRCTFERGVLSLYFNFKSHWYRR